MARPVSKPSATISLDAASPASPSAAKPPAVQLLLESDVAYTLDLEGRRLLATGGANPGPYSTKTARSHPATSKWANIPLGPAAT
jgi:hypothetical protein